MSQFSNIDPTALDNVAGGLVTSRSSTNDQLLMTMNTLSQSISQINNQNNNGNGFNNPMMMMVFALMASQQKNNSTTVVSTGGGGYRPFWW